MSRPSESPNPQAVAPAAATPQAGQPGGTAGGWRTPSNWSLRTQLLVLTLPLLVCVCVITVLYGTALARERVAAARWTAQSTGREVAAELGRFMQRTEQTMTQLAGRPSIRAMGVGACDPILTDLPVLIPEYALAVLRDREGRDVCMPHGAERVSAGAVVGQSWFQQVLHTGRYLLAGPLLSPVTGRWVLVPAYPVRDLSGRVAGLLAVRLDLLQMQMRVLPSLPADVQLSVLDADGRALFGWPTPEQRIGRPVFDPRRMGDRMAPGYAGLEVSQEADGVTRIRAWQAVEGVPWTVTVAIAEPTGVHALSAGMTWGVLVLGGGLLLTVLAVLAFARQLARPITSLRRAAERVALGDTQARAVVQGPVEVATVARVFNQMVTEHHHARQREHRQADFYAALSRTNGAIVRMTDDQSLFREICRICVEHGHATMAFIALVQDGQVEPVAWAGAAARTFLSGIELPLSPPGGQLPGPIATAVLEARPYVANDLMGDPRTGPWQARARQIGSQATAAFPFRRGGRIAGVLSVHIGERDFFNEPVVALLSEVVTDISFGLDNIDREMERRQAIERARGGLQRFQLIFDAAPMATLISDGLDGTLTAANDAACRLLALPRERLVGQRLDALNLWADGVQRDRLAAILDADGSIEAQEARVRTADGEVRDTLISARPIDLGERRRVLSILNDVTDRKRYAARIEHLSTHDDLTGLPNRNLMLDRITQAVGDARRRQRVVAVVVADIDRFKVVNEGFGRAVGDQLLRAVAERLHQGLHDADSIARWGDDAYVMLLPELASVGDVESRMQQILDVLEAPVAIADRRLHVSCSLGVSMFPMDSIEADALVHDAEVAMLRAKRQARGSYRFFTSEMNEGLQHRADLEMQLRSAIEHEQLFLVYQPKVDLRTGLIEGAEALVRWRHPALGEISPATFIPIAEDSGQIGQIGEWVLRSACRQNKAWQAAGLPPIVVCVNISAPQFLEHDIVGRVGAVLAETGLDPRFLELEITESLIAQDVERVIDIILQLKRIGVRFAIDDFGTGYSSLSYLRRFQVDRLKIDRSFISRLHEDSGDAAICLAVISLAHTLKMKVTAEGVETIGQYHFLCEHACDEAQGYLFSRPIAVESFAPLLTASGRGSLMPGRQPEQTGQATG